MGHCIQHETLHSLYPNDYMRAFKCKLTDFGKGIGSMRNFMDCCMGKNNYKPF